MLYNFAVGEKFGKILNQSMIFLMEKSGPIVILNWDAVTTKEFEDISKGDFKIKCFVKGQVAYLLMKFGSQNWMDLPFNVKVSGALKPEDLSEIEDGQGYGLHVVLINADNNIVLANRLIGLQTKFSRNLRKVFLEQLAGDYDAFDYQVTASNISQAYSTKELVKMADF